MLEGINSRLEDTEENISGLEDRVLESIQIEQQKEKRFFKKEDRLRDLLNNSKQTNIHLIGVPEEEERKVRILI